MPKSPASKPSAPKCPVCQRELSLREASLTQCPHCGASLSAAGQPGSGPDAGKATVPGIGQTIQADDLEFVGPKKPPAGDQPGAGKGTIDETTQRKTVDERSLPPAQPAPGGQTIDESHQRQTIDEHSLPAPSKIPPGSQTLDERTIGQTLDDETVRALSQSQPPPAPGKGQRTIDERQLSQTFDSADFGPRPGAGTVPDRVIERTLDSADLSAADQARLNQLWADALQPGARPGMTIKGGESGTSRAEANLKIQQRTLRQAGDCKTAEADYELLDMLGQGGMGVVYTARQASIDRTVALKMIKTSSAADVVQREKFLSEAVVTGELDHPNIVPIYDLGCNEQGALFYAMKRVEGTPWHKVIAEKSLHENVEILMKVADAVGFAHSRGIIHRDLKPENVMLGGYGEVLVMDWGLALPTPEFSKSGTISASAGMGGTPAYMAPEMASGRGEEITSKSDIYLLGAILFEIVTGVPPHTGKSTMTCLFAAAKNDIVKTDKSGELIEVALKAMATRPEDRYATVADFQTGIRDYLSHSESIALSSRAEDDLRQAKASDEYQDFARAVFAFEEAVALWDGNTKAQRGLTIARVAYAESASRKGDYDLGLSLVAPDEPDHAPLRTAMLAAKRERDARQQRLKTMRRLMVGGVGVFMAVVSGAAVWINSERSEAVKQKGFAEIKKKEAEDNLVEAERQKKKAEENFELAETQRKKAEENFVEAEKQRKKAEENFELAETQRKKAEENFELAKIQRKKAEDNFAEAEKQRKKAEEAAVKEKDARVAAEMARKKEEEAKQDALAKRREAELAKMKEEKARLAAEDSEKKAVAARKTAEEARKAAEEAKALEVKAKLAAQESEKKAVAAKEAEEYEAYVALIGLAAAKIDENAFGTARQLLESCRPRLRNWEWGRLMHICAQESNSYDAGDRVDAVAFSHDGKQFVTGSWNGLAQIWNVETGKSVDLPHPGLYVHAVAFSGNGRRVATGASDNTIRIWDVATRKIVHTLTGHKDQVMSVAFSRDDSRLLSASLDQTAKLWDIATDKELRSYVGHTWWVWHAAFSPDETQIVTASQDGTCRLWSTDTAKASAPFTGHRGPVYSAVFSPDGQTVASAGYDKRVLLWRPDDVRPYDYRKLPYGEVVPQPRFKALDGHLAAVRSVAFSSDGQRLISGGHDNAVNLWHVESGQLIKSLRGHDSWVRACAFSPDDQWVVSAGYDAAKQIKRWNIAGYEEVRVLRGQVLRGHSDAVFNVAFSQVGGFIATASRDRTAKMFDFATGKERLTFVEGHAYLAARAAFFGHGKRLATSAIDNTVRIWDVDSGTQLHRLDGAGQNAALAVAWDAAQGYAPWLVTGSDDAPPPDASASKKSKPSDIALAAKNRERPPGGYSAQVWSTQTGKPLQRLAGHRAPVTAVAVSPDNRLVFTGDEFGKGKVWETATWRELKSLEGPSRRKITAAAFLPNGDLLTAGMDNTVTHWNITDGREVPSLLLRHPDGVLALAVTPNGRQAITTCLDGKARVWDVQRAQVVGELKPESAKGRFEAVDISADGAQAATVYTKLREIYDKERQEKRMEVAGVLVQLWNMTDFGEKRLPTKDDRVGPFLDAEAVGGSFWSAVFSPNGKSLVTVGGDSARLWDVDSPRQPQRDRMSFSPSSAVAAVDFSPDASLLVTGSWDNSAKLWSTKTGLAVRKLVGEHKSLVNSAVFSPGRGEFVLTGSDDHTAVLWDTAKGEAVRTFTGHTDRVRSAVFSFDGQQVLTASSDKTARLWNTKTGELVQTFTGHARGVLCAAMSRDGRRIVTASEDNTAKIWDAKTGKELKTIAGHTAAVTSVDFSPDGLRVLTGSDDYTAKLWDASPGHEGKAILNLKGHTQEVTSVRFSYDGRYVCTGSRDGTAVVWLTRPWQEARAVGEAVSQNAAK